MARPEPDASEIGPELIKHLAEERSRRHLTQAEVARRMNTSQSYVARLEKGTLLPKLDTFLSYALIVAGGALLAKLLRDLTRTPFVA